MMMFAHSIKNICKKCGSPMWEIIENDKVTGYCCKNGHTFTKSQFEAEKVLH